MDGMQRQIISREPGSQFVRILGRAIIEMPARAEQLDRGDSRARRFAHQGRRQFLVYKKICGENALHRHNLRARLSFMERTTTLSDASMRVKAGPRRPNDGKKLHLELGNSRFRDTTLRAKIRRPEGRESIRRRRRVSEIRKRPGGRAGHSPASTDRKS